MSCKALQGRRLVWHLRRMETRKNKQGRTCKAIKAISMTAAMLCSVAAAMRPCCATQLTKQTAQAFDQYIRTKEARDDRELAAKRDFLWIDGLPPTEKAKEYAELKQGQILAQRSDDCNTQSCMSIPGGLIHDWIGIVFVPGISIPQALAVLQDYGHDAKYYRPEVVKAKLLVKSGDEYRVYLRLKQVDMITVVLDTEYDIRYTRIDSEHVYSRSYSTRVAEVDHAGAKEERDEPVGNDHGFLWRLYSYWRFYEADGGVYIQCDAVSLTRDVPTGLGWLIGSFIEKIPAESLRSTLTETRAALLQKLAPVK
ncbi:MAG: hypothetical protein WBD23_15190 [Candidatus Acidiferrales bacterium]